MSIKQKLKKVNGKSKYFSINITNIKQKLKKINLARIYSPTLTIMCLVSPIIFVELFSSFIENSSSRIIAAILIISFLATPLLSIASAIIYTINSFKKHKNTYEKLLKLVITYIILILNFSNLYYIESCMGDYTDATSQYFNYSSYTGPFADIPSVVEEKNRLISNNYKFDSERAFKGINNRLWSGVDYKTMDYRQEEVKFTDEIIANSDIPINHLDKIVNFIPDNRIEVYTDCLYLSTMTISNFGFENITPNLWYSKLTVTLEIILGQVLVVLAVGFFFSNMNHEN